MIGLRQLSNNRLELYASRFPLETLKPFLLERYAQAYATIVLYEDNIELYHETGIFSFDASEPETFNYEEFQAPLVEEFHDRVAVCTIENLFKHFDAFAEERPMEDDPFHNLVFSITTEPPPREQLLGWEKKHDQNLQRVLFDDNAAEHLQLFADEMAVIYSHGNHFTSITSSHEDLILAVFEDMVEKQMTAIGSPPLPPAFLKGLYTQLKNYGTVRLKTERFHHEKDGSAFLLASYPNRSTLTKRTIAKIRVDNNGVPVSIDTPEMVSYFNYQTRFSDPYLLPMVVMALFMLAIVGAAAYFKTLFPGHVV